MKKPNKPMFWVGIVMIIAVAIVFLTVEKDLGLSPMVIGIFGIVAIGASGYMPMK